MVRRYSKALVVVSGFAFLFLISYNSTSIKEATGRIVHEAVMLGMDADMSGMEHSAGTKTDHEATEGMDPDMPGMEHGSGVLTGHESTEGMDPDMPGMEHEAVTVTGHKSTEGMDPDMPGMEHGAVADAGHDSTENMDPDMPGMEHEEGLEAEVKRPRVAVLSSFGFVSFLVLVVAFVMKRKNEVLAQSKKLERANLNKERANER